MRYPVLDPEDHGVLCGIAVLIDANRSCYPDEAFGGRKGVSDRLGVGRACSAKGIDNYVVRVEPKGCVGIRRLTVLALIGRDELLRYLVGRRLRAVEGADGHAFHRLAADAHEFRRVESVTAEYRDFATELAKLLGYEGGVSEIARDEESLRFMRISPG